MVASHGLPRVIEVPLALLGLAVCSPVLCAAAAAVKASSKGPWLFRQQRVGRGGRRFNILKLRTMRADPAGSRLTAAGDPRITGVGRLLRRTKIDEIPQLWNVIRGDMALVGPRPEVPEFVDLEHPGWREVLRVRPGLTDPVSLELINEEEVLSAYGTDFERSYREEVLPRKLEGYADYLQRRTALVDLGVLLRTVWTLVSSRAASPGGAISNGKGKQS